MKDLTATQIIAKSLKIKDIRKFRYSHIFNALGLELVQEEMSAQGYYSVVHKETGNRLVISKDYNNKTRLYCGYGAVTDCGYSVKEELEKVDLYNFLLKHNNSMKDFMYTYTYKNHKNYRNKVRAICFPRTQTQEYLNLKNKIADTKKYKQWKVDEYYKIEKQIEQLRKQQESLVEAEKKYEADILKFEIEIGELTVIK